MSQPDVPNRNWDPLYAPSLQIEARPLLPVYLDFATTANKVLLGHDVGKKSHLATHLREIPELRGLLEKVLSRKEIDFDQMKVGERLVIKQHMGRDVGTTDQVELKDTHHVYYAIRENREDEEIFTKFAKDAKSSPTPWLTAIVERVKHPRYKGIVHTAWTGPHAPPFPHRQLALDDPAKYREGVEFWSGDIALTDANMKIVPGTARLDCPWAGPALAMHRAGTIELSSETVSRLRSS